jgi:hypothetical protein
MPESMKALKSETIDLICDVELKQHLKGKL